jgi:hypothetical protein
MNYEKLTPETFVTKLKGNQYESLTGARRAIGKASWSDADKESARAKALKFFGDNGAAPAAKPAAKTAAPKAPKKMAVAKVVKAPKGKPGRKPKAAAASTDKVADKKPYIPAEVGEHYTDILKQTKNVTLADVRKNPHATLQLAEHGVQAGTAVIRALNEMKEKNPGLEVSDTVDAATETLRAAMHLSLLVLQNLSDGIENKSVSHAKTMKETVEAVVGSNESVGATSGVNGVAESPVPGTPTYEAPSSPES